jgi:hypothetical protein
MSDKHPMQPVVLDGHGVIRFKQNAVVRYLLDAGGIDMNMIAVLPFSQDDRQHFAQLIGYSVDGYAELEYHSGRILKAADKAAEKLRK